MVEEVTDMLQIIDQIHRYHETRGKIYNENPRMIKKISKNVKLIYEKDKTTFYHLKKENLFVKRRISQSDWIKLGLIKESKISLMMNHKNVAKTYLTVQTKKGSDFESILVGEYYKGTVDEKTFKTSDIMHDYIVQLTEAVDHLHSQNIHYNAFFAPRATRSTNLANSMNARQKRFILTSYTNLKKRIEDDKKKAEEDDENGTEEDDEDGTEENKNKPLIYLDVKINEKAINSATSNKKSDNVNGNPIYVLCDFFLSETYEKQETLSWLSKEYEESTNQKLNEFEIALKLSNDIHCFAFTIFYLREKFIRGEGYHFFAAYSDWASWGEPRIYENSENTIEKLLCDCCGPHKLRPDIRKIWIILQDKKRFMDFLMYKPTKIDLDSDDVCT